MGASLDQSNDIYTYGVADSDCFHVLIAKNLADPPFLSIRQIRTKAEIETRIAHAGGAWGRRLHPTMTRARPGALARGFTTISTSLPSSLA